MSFKKWLSRSDKSSKQKAAAEHGLEDSAAKPAVPENAAEKTGKSDTSLGDKLLNVIVPSGGSKAASYPDRQSPVLAMEERHHGHRDFSGASNDPKSASSFAISDSDDPEFEYDLFPLLRPETSKLLPYGDGSNKVFGYENFGNTCYCNSVLQVIYNLPELRSHILQFPPKDPAVPRKRKTHMPGLKPRIFDDTSFILPTNGSDHSRKGSNCNGNCSSKDTGPRKNSNPPSRDRESFKSATSPRSYRSHSSATVHGTVMASDAITEKLHEGYTRIVVGRTGGKSGKKAYHQEIPTLSSSAPTPGSSVPSSSSNSSVGSSTKPEETSSEERKKAALIKGPVINVDHSFTENVPANEKAGLYTAVKDLYESITENICLTGVVSPIQFVETLKRENVLFSTMMHQDAHEFLNFLLNEISDYLDAHRGKELEDGEGSESKEANFIDQLFKGTLTNRTRCLTCDNVTYRNEPFLDFAIEVHEDKDTDIQTTLSDFHQKEMLNGANKFYCDECCGLQEAERVVGLKQLPFYLALHMKRFKYSEKHNCNVKLFNKIHYPLTLKVCSTFDSSVCKRYELVGLVVHMGGGPHHGHYVSLCKTDKFGWLLFDDETVETVNESTVLKFMGNSDDLTTAYLLFYKEMSVVDEKADGLDKRQKYAEAVDELVRLDEKIRSNMECNRTDHSCGLGDVPEGRNIRVKSSSKGSRRRSRLFSFKKSTKE
ncbi:LANO_0F11320g1_1 [Lachancea nothofagi CBS 11611]|uniref:Ubiquitin carboxyl-terminal hydrolase n=1 Tax=Lachancea nothofagi CBS 11611 TaxID=1266666 RepID=A0A1G4KAZ1_9SACH|nr:LANO_0F11320g1_1 [Lachancea nothofagi CBS 11611]